MTKFCEVDECGVEVSEGCGTYTGRVLCPRCASSFRYWRGRGVAAFHHRQEQLAFLTSRANYLESHIGELVRAAKQRAADAHRRARDRRTH